VTKTGISQCAPRTLGSLQHVAGQDAAGGADKGRETTKDCHVPPSVPIPSTLESDLEHPGGSPICFSFQTTSYHNYS